MKTFSKINFTKSVYILLFLVPTLFIGLSFQKGKGGKDLKIGAKAPMLTTTLPGADGKDYTLEKIKEENGFIVIFSCNTCPFVVGNSNFEGWERQYNDLHKKAQEHKIGLVLVNSNAAFRDGVDSKSEMKMHGDSVSYTMPYVIDEKAKMADAFGARTTPHVYMFNSDNKLVYKGSIDNTWDSKREKTETYLYDAMESVAAGNKIETNSTTPRGCSIKRVKK